MRPGARLRSFASRVCSRSTMDRLIDPVIADMQCEHEQASRGGQRWRRRWILLEGYLAFWRVLALHVPLVWTKRAMREWAAADHSAVGRALGSAALTMLILNGVLIAAPLQGITRNDGHVAWLLFLLLPQSLPLSLPLSLFVGVLYGLRDRPVTIPVRRAILVIGLAGSLASFGTITWLVPAADHAFRVTIAAHHVVRGPAEISVGSLRDRALAKKQDGRLNQAGGLLFSYHARWALVGAVLAFALFGLGVTGLRASRAATAGIATIGCVVYVTYFFELSYIRSSVFSDERAALGLAWLPNILLIVVSLIFLSASHETDVPGQFSTE
jgi:hypothetical protein